MSVVERISALAGRIASEFKAIRQILSGLGSLSAQDAAAVDISGGRIESVTLADVEIDGGALLTSRGNVIMVVRATRAQLVAQANAGQLIAGEPYLITDEGRLAWAISSSEFRSAVTQDDLKGFTFFSQDDA